MRAGASFLQFSELLGVCLQDEAALLAVGVDPAAVDPGVERGLGHAQVQGQVGKPPLVGAGAGRAPVACRVPGRTRPQPSQQCLDAAGGEVVGSLGRAPALGVEPLGDLRCAQALPAQDRDALGELRVVAELLETGDGADDVVLGGVPAVPGDHVVLALVHGSGYERIASPGCSDRTIRRRVKQWAELGIAQKVHALALEAYDRVIGLGLTEISVDGCITKAPSGGEKAGRSPVDRGKQGLKRSVASDACGVPLGIVSDGANRHDAPLLGPTLAAACTQVSAMPEGVNVNLDRGYDGAKSRALLAELGFTAEIARKGVPAPIQAGKRWVVERTHSWMNDYGKLRRCTDKNGKVVDFYLHLAAVLVTLRMLIRRATKRYRWDSRPTTRRLK